MSYSIKLIQSPHADSDNCRLIRIQVICNRIKCYAPTVAKVTTEQFNGSAVVDHPKERKMNAAITAHKSGIEDRLLDELRKNPNITKCRLAQIVKDKQAGPVVIKTYIEGLQQSLKGKISNGRLKHYAVMADKLANFNDGATFADVSISWLKKLEMFLRLPDKDGFKIAANTISSNMSIVRSVLNKAAEDGLLDKKQFEFFKFPAAVETLPVYLEESEVTKLYNLAVTLGDGNLKLSGYYFLLSCYAGYRIGDSKKFNYDDMVQDGQITLRAGKNGKIVSIPVHTRLAAVIDYIKDRPIDITFEHMRKFVKELCGLAGINKHVKFHTSRHSFAMLLMKSGFTIDDVAYLLGDTPAIARVYAKIHNPTLNAKVMDLLG